MRILQRKQNLIFLPHRAFDGGLQQQQQQQLQKKRYTFSV